jgi:hypothetical protein
VSVRVLSPNGQRRSLLGFVIGSFDVQNFILCFGDFGPMYLGLQLKNLEEAAKTRQVQS